MVHGVVNRHGEPVVSLQLVLRHGLRAFPAVIDTGFNGYLSVPERIATRGGWQLLGTEDFEIATGQSVAQRVYLGDVIFDRSHVRVYAVATDATDILIGTRLLARHTLTINFRRKSVTLV